MSHALRHGRVDVGALGLLVAGTVVGLALLELALRILDPAGPRVMGDRIVLPAHERVRFTNADSPKLDPVIEFQRNSLGFRGPEPPPDFADWLTLVAIGGSTTEDAYLTAGRSWPEQLGAALERPLRRLWVNNAGLDGHSTLGHGLLLEQIVIDLRPNVALFLVGINDLGASAEALERLRAEPPLHVRIARRSALWAAAVNLRRYLDAQEFALEREERDPRRLPKGRTGPRLRESLLPSHQREYLPGYRERVRRLVEQSRANGILPVLVTQPALYGPVVDPTTGVDLSEILIVLRVRHDKPGLVDGALAWELLEAYNDVLRDEARRAGVDLVDLAHRMPKDSRLYYDLIHYTNEGAARVAEIVAGELCPVLAARFPSHVAGPCP